MSIMKLNKISVKVPQVPNHYFIQGATYQHHDGCKGAHPILVTPLGESTRIYQIRSYRIDGRLTSERIIHEIKIT